MADMEPCLVFLDVDGTLLFRGEICGKDVEALRRLGAAGHKIFINSGRSRAVLPKQLLDAVEFDGFVCGSTYVEYHGEVLHRVLVDDATVRAVCRYAKENGVRMLLEGETHAYGVYGGAFHACVDITDRLDTYLEEPSRMRVTKITFDRDLPPAVAETFSGIRVINFGGYSEAIVRGYDKAFGMRFLGEKLGIPRENTVAFGDSVNDTEMLAYAGKSVIMHSAPASLDRYATLRADADFGGVALGIEKIFFGESK